MHRIKDFGAADGQNCLFLCLSYYLYGTERKYDELRQKICDYIEKNEDKYAPFMNDLTVAEYVKQMRRKKTPGDEIEINAFEDLFQSNVRVLDEKSLTELRNNSIYKDTVTLCFRQPQHPDGIGHYLLRDFRARPRTARGDDLGFRGAPGAPRCVPATAPRATSQIIIRKSNRKLNLVPKPVKVWVDGAAFANKEYHGKTYSGFIEKKLKKMPFTIIRIQNVKYKIKNEYIV